MSKVADEVEKLRDEIKKLREDVQAIPRYYPPVYQPPVRLVPYPVYPQPWYPVWPSQPTITFGTVGVGTTNTFTSVESPNSITFTSGADTWTQA